MPSNIDAKVLNLRLEIERSLGQGPVLVSIADIVAILKALESVTVERDAAMKVVMTVTNASSEAAALVIEMQRDYPYLFKTPESEDAK